MKKTFLCLVLTLSFLFTLAASAMSAHELALEQAKACAFSSEYYDSSNNCVSRWTRRIDVCFQGHYTDQDVAFFHNFLIDLAANVPGLPTVSIVNKPGDANVTIHFVRYNDMNKIISTYVSGNWGYFSTRWRNHDITSATIAIAYDKCDQKARNHLMMEEFVGALGLSNDHCLDKNSVLYQNWTTVQSLTAADWNMLRMVYDDRIYPGMPYSKAISIMKTIY